MIFAHGPGGFLAVFLSRKIWNKDYSKKTQWFFYGIGTFFGVLVDFDLFFYFFINALKSHRETIGHTLILHLLIMASIFFVGHILKNKYLKSISIVYGVATLTHLVLDSISAGVMWFYPFSTQLYGILAFSWFSNSFLAENLFLISFTFETLIICAFFIIAIKLFDFKTGLKTFFTSSVLIFGILVLTLIVWHSNHTFSPKNNPFYGDIDQDKIVNRSDIDVDNDGVNNFYDFDANGNGISNIDEIVAVTPKLNGVKYDPSNGKYYELFDRLGFYNGKDMLKETFAVAGVFVGEEMKKDYESNPKGYIGKITDSKFADSITNYYTFFLNNATLVTEKNAMKTGDVIFFGDEPLSSGIVSRIENNNVYLIYVDVNHRGGEYLFEDILSWNGGVKNIFRLPIE